MKYFYWLLGTAHPLLLNDVSCESLTEWLKLNLACCDDALVLHLLSYTIERYQDKLVHSIVDT